MHGTRLCTALLLVTTLGSSCMLVRQSEVDALFNGESTAGTDSADGASSDGTSSDGTSSDGTDGTEDSASPPDADGDGFSAAEDCDDGDPTRFPGAPEWVDDVDQDCDEQPLPAPTALSLPARDGTLGPIQLAKGARDGESLAVLAWASLQCTPESGVEACLGRRTWQPSETTAAAADDSLITLGDPETGDILDLAYREYDASMGAVVAMRVDGSTIVSNFVLTASGISHSWNAGDQAPIEGLEEATKVTVDLQIVQLVGRIYVQTVLCSNSNLLRGAQYYAGYLTEIGGSVWGSTDLEVCGITTLQPTAPYFMYGDGAEVYFADVLALATGPTSAAGVWEAAGTVQALASSPYAEPITEAAPTTPRSNAYASAEGLSVVFANAEGVLVGESHAIPGGVQAVGVDVDEDAGVASAAWLCLVAGDGSASLGRAGHPDDRGGLELYPVILPAPATGCSVAVVAGRHLVAGFDTSTTPFLVEAPLPPPATEEAAY